MTSQRDIKAALEWIILHEKAMKEFGGSNNPAMIRIYMAIQSVLEASLWKPIYDMPRDGTDILVSVPKIINVMGLYDPAKQAVCNYDGYLSVSHVGGYECEEDIELEYATHFMPLPVPPEENE